MSEIAVSCIMPTRGRRGWVPLAVRCWLEQTLPAFARELIVIDDGPDPCEAEVGGQRSEVGERIRYVYLEGEHSIGEKFNVGCELARGEVMAAWADDDYHAPRRLEYQLDQLMASRAGVCGCDSLLYWAPAERSVWLFEWRPGERTNEYIAGGTMMWRRQFWEERPFDTLRASGEDLRWIAGRGPLLGTLDWTFYLATLHQGNTGAPDRELRELSSRWVRVPPGVVWWELAPVWWVGGVKTLTLTLTPTLSQRERE